MTSGTPRRRTGLLLQLGQVMVVVGVAVLVVGLVLRGDSSSVVVGLVVLVVGLVMFVLGLRARGRAGRG